MAKRKPTAGQRSASKGLDKLTKTFRRWLYLPDPGVLYVALATVAANRPSGSDPIWLLLVGGSSSVKTEIINSLGKLDEVTPASDLTKQSLLSGVPKKEVESGASGGLLKEIGEYGIVTLKDFGTVLSMRPDQRAEVLAALREIYDGSWKRHLGTGGGKTLQWAGKLGLIGGVTSVIDRHHVVIESLGSRFLLYRVEIDNRAKQSEAARRHRRDAKDMREELSDAVVSFMSSLKLPSRDSLSDADGKRLDTLADFVTLARSPVERETYSSKEIEFIPDAEGPARFVNQIASLLEGLRRVGVSEPEAWRLIRAVAFGSMPTQRRRLIEHLASERETTTKKAAVVLGLPTTTARRTLEDLTAHSVVERIPRKGKNVGEPDRWKLSPWAEERLDEID